jgi:hypothetical protein
MTSFVDLDTGRPGWLFGLTPSRSGAAVQAPGWPLATRHGAPVSSVATATWSANGERLTTRRHGPAWLVFGLAAQMRAPS